ncbi:MAG: DUF1553 domain-containing protein [Verrucomicrobiaceae bacterium]|nr:DUF1553 domain-containing protein [Verrucomicrobiaceae bacterium]
MNPIVSASMHRGRALVPLLCAAAGAGFADGTLPDKIEFNRDIRPILSDACYQCHGPDKNRRKADLRLDVERDAKAKHDGRFVITPGKPADSELMRRITTDDKDDQMPPPDSKRQLNPREIALLRDWIVQGAQWQAHWAFIPPQRPDVPTVADCGLQATSWRNGQDGWSDWGVNPIDGFILKKMTGHGLAPAPEASPETIIRRMTLDLTGLPPTLDEVDALVRETGDWKAEVAKTASASGGGKVSGPPSPRLLSSVYSGLADRLLSSSRYGERMAIRWLDAARYADTNGYQTDGERWMWRWRDWVIDSFNANMPFDQFTIEQIAGDLLPGATMSQRLATGFNRNHRGNAEGGIVPEEFAVEYVVDRVDTTCTVWLGLTMGCARCHDHKYDPFTQRDFYSIFACFNNVPEKGKAIKVGNSVPAMPAPTKAQERELEQIERDLAAAESRLKQMEPRIEAAQAAWEKALIGGAANEWTVTRSMQARFARTEDFDGTRFVDGGDAGDFGYFDKFTLAAWIKPQAGADGAILSRMVEDPKDSAFASIDEGYRVYLKDGRVQLHLTKRWLDDALRVETEERIPVGDWQHIVVSYDGSRMAAGVKIFVNGRPQKLRVLLDMLNQTFATKQPFRIGSGGSQGGRFRGQIRDVRVYARVLTSEDVGAIAASGNVSALAAIPAEKRTPQQAVKLRACFFESGADGALREARADAVTLRERRTAFIESIPTVMVMEEMPVPREAFILKRGVYDQRGERVFPATPASLTAPPANEKINRLGFAKWLVSGRNPLTARVAVNQLWQMIFGAGLVKTAEDFGSQGEPPSHPELLDWLADEFMRTGWDVKRILRLMVTSATYRQASRVEHVDAAAGADGSRSLPAAPSALLADPDNRLLSHGPRVRLPAEMIRDQALSAAGLLVENLGGPSVKPYQPPGLGKELSGTDIDLDHGEKLFRRSLYTFWKRTSPQPTMTAFDAPGREMCSVRPTRTDTPLQALALMNDVTFVEAARALAQRVMREEATAAGRVRHAFRLVLAREPKAEELGVLLAGMDDQLSRFRRDPAAARSLLGAGESPLDENLDAVDHAAFAVVCGLIINLDEAVTRP